jgi:hypothetical protein
MTSTSGRGVESVEGIIGEPRSTASVSDVGAKRVGPGSGFIWLPWDERRRKRA